MRYLFPAGTPASKQGQLGPQLVLDLVTWITWEHSCRGEEWRESLRGVFFEVGLISRRAIDQQVFLGCMSQSGKLVGGSEHDAPRVHQGALLLGILSTTRECAVIEPSNHEYTSTTTEVCDQVNTTQLCVPSSSS